MNKQVLILLVLFMSLLCSSSIASSLGGYTFYNKNKPTEPPSKAQKVDEITFKMIYNPITRNYLFSDGNTISWGKEKNSDQVWNYKKNRLIHLSTQKCLDKYLNMAECNYTNDDQTWNVTTKQIQNPNNDCISAGNELVVQLRKCETEDRNDQYQYFEWPKS